MIYDNIIAQLKAIATANTALKVVYDVLPKATTAYPYCAIIPTNYTDSYQSTRDMRRNYTITLYLFSNLTDNYEDGQKQLRDIVDDLTDSIEADVTLAGTVDFVASVQGALKFATREAPLFVAEITVVASKLISRF